MTSWHCFSYGAWYAADNVGFGPLSVLNHDLLAPGAGFDAHQHSGYDLVTVVVAGALRHSDSNGHEAVVRAGEVQLLRSGAGVTHSERNASATEPVEYVQMWLRSTEPEVSYGQPSVAGDPSPELVSLATGRLSRVILHRPDERREFGGSHVHAYVLSGSVRLGDAVLEAGDAVRATDDEFALFGTDTRSQLLVWQLHDIGAASGAVPFDRVTEG